MTKPTKQKSLKVNVVMDLILNLSIFIFPLITFPYISRVLTPVGTGRVAFVTSVATFFINAGMLGIPLYGLRTCAKLKDDKDKLSKAAFEIFVINCATMGISIFCYVVSIIFVPRMWEENILFFITVLSLILNLVGFDWLFRAMEEFTFITVRSIVFKVISITAMFILVHQVSDYVVYGAINVFAHFGGCLCNLYNLKKLVKFRRFENLEFKKHIKPIFVFSFVSLSAYALADISPAIIGFISTDAEVGYFNAALRIRFLFVSLVNSMGSVLLPRSCYYLETDNKDEFEKLFVQVLQFVFFASLPICFFFIVFAQPTITLLAGAQFASAILPTQILLPVVLFSGLSNLFSNQILFPSNRESVVLRSLIAGSLVNIALCFATSSFLGATGAAVASLIGEFLVALIQFIPL
ncbi:MAG: flippase, partial [Enterococcus sp.]|nr:flippase [Enterococcus sp.]